MNIWPEYSICCLVTTSVASVTVYLTCYDETLKNNLVGDTKRVSVCKAYQFDFPFKIEQEIGKVNSSLFVICQINAS